MKTSKRLFYGITLVAGTVMATTGLDAMRHNGPLNNSLVNVASAAATADPSDTAANQLSHAFRRATSNAMPGVVFIDIEQRRNGSQEFSGNPFEDMMRGQAGPQIREGSGSGFVFRPDGYIITNNHVVEGATHVSVVTQDRREFTATVVGRDPLTDVAVVKIDARGLPVVPLGNSDNIEVGDWAVALGYPLQLGATATAGIVSAKGRSIGILDAQGSTSPIEYYIQTDAAINPGNSGGPLVDLQGRVIGINSAIKSPTGYYSGYGFSIPINIAVRVANDLIQNGVVRRPKLGVALSGISAADAQVYKLPRVAGAQVIQAPEAGSPADRAGFHIGDVIVALNGKAVDTDADLRERLALFEPGDNVTFDVIRYGEKKQFNVKLGQFDMPKVAAQEPEPRSSNDAVSKLGFEVTPLTAQMARQVSNSVRSGLVITSVVPASPADHADLRPGILLTSVNGRAVSTPEEVQAIARTLKPGEAVSLMLSDAKGKQQILNFQVRI